MYMAKYLRLHTDRYLKISKKIKIKTSNKKQKWSIQETDLFSIINKYTTNDKHNNITEWVV